MDLISSERSEDFIVSEANDFIVEPNLPLTKGENEITIPEGITFDTGDKLMLWKIDFIKLKSVSKAYVIE